MLEKKRKIQKLSRAETDKQTDTTSTKGEKKTEGDADNIYAIGNWHRAGNTVREHNLADQTKEAKLNISHTIEL